MRCLVLHVHHDYQSCDENPELDVVLNSVVAVVLSAHVALRVFELLSDMCANVGALLVVSLHAVSTNRFVFILWRSGL
jgi:hypothetical protein